MPSTSARQERLEREIEEMEQALLGNPEEPVEEPSETQESQTLEAEETAVETETETEVSESAPEAITPDPEDVAGEATKAKRNDWKKRYINYKASTDSTIHQQRQEIISLTEANLNMSKQIDELAKQVANLSSNEVKIEDLISDEQREIIGEETLDALQKLQKASVDKQVAPLKAELEAERVRKLEAAQSKLSTDKETIRLQFISRLAQVVPDYAEIDSNPQFINWMDEADEDSGLTRRYIFKQAQGLGDVGRVAGFMKEFKRITSQPAKALESKISPKKSSASQPTNQQSSQEPTIWTQAGIDAFYNDRIRGRFRGTEKEAQAIEREIDLAIQEGRIR